jgi:hypothetical protein
MGSGSIASRILILATKCKPVVSFTPQMLYPRESAPGPIKYEIEWTSEPDWRLWRRDKSVVKIEFIGKWEMFYFLLASLKEWMFRLSSLKCEYWRLGWDWVSVYLIVVLHVVYTCLIWNISVGAANRPRDERRKSKGSILGRRKESFLLSITSRPALGATLPPLQSVSGLLPREQSGEGVQLTTHLRQCGGQERWSYALTPPYICMI